MAKKSPCPKTHPSHEPTESDVADAVAFVLFPTRRRKTASGGFEFTDTFTARMLRLVLEIGSISQAEFMRTYHEICARPNPGKSSFACNFSRYTRVLQTSAVPRLLEQRRVRVNVGDYFPTTRINVRLRWVGPDFWRLMRAMSDGVLQGAYERMESLYTSVDPATADVGEIATWVERLQREVQRRADLELGNLSCEMPAVGAHDKRRAELQLLASLAQGRA